MKPVAEGFFLLKMLQCVFSYHISSLLEFQDSSPVAPLILCGPSRLKWEAVSGFQKIDCLAWPGIGTGMAS